MLAENNYSQLAVSLMNSIGFCGFFITGFYTDRFIHWAGLTQTFIICALVGGILGGMFFVVESYYGLLALRLMLGVIVGVMYIVIESWILMIPPLKKRGQHFAFYMVVLYLGQTFSPFLLELQFNNPKNLFMLASWFCLSSMLPIIVSNNKVIVINPAHHTQLNIMQVFKKSLIGFMGCVISGVLLASYTSLIPYYAVKENYSVSLLMSSLVAGGSIFQWPLGLYADLFGRQQTLKTLFIALTMPSLFLFYAHDQFYLSIAIFLVGGLSFAIYPISIALTCDLTDDHEVVSVTKILLLAWSLGAIFGLPVVAAVMDLANMNQLLFLITGILSLLSAGAIELLTPKNRY
jgi:MFS family permease